MADAVIAVSRGTRDDLLHVTRVPPERIHVIYNGIDTGLYRPVEAFDALQLYGVDPHRPYVLFVGRITRQKGIVHLARAIPLIDAAAQVVLCAGAPETLPREAIIQLYSHARVFCCPSIYEPFGIINLEAMACETPVVGTAVGGIPEVVIDGETGILVPLEQQAEAPFEPLEPKRFSADLASAINRLLGDAVLSERMAQAGRRRVEREFAWPAIARQTAELYAGLMSSG
jgi:glycosyltransferase involved in cell wall biosynthesis